MQINLSKFHEVQVGTIFVHGFYLQVQAHYLESHLVYLLTKLRACAQSL